ncbi:MAG TPA: hypothetical protein VI942_09525, partial [Thermoanaerobaculia bacterium]|nr:hypothetical protein [Thermoanaerobaculia bacterium]
MADESDRAAGDPTAQSLDTLAGAGRAERDAQAEPLVGFEDREPIGVRPRREVDLVDGQRGFDAAVAQRDQKTVDETGGERRIAQRRDHDREIEIGGQDPLPMGVERIGAREPACARQHLGHDELARRPADELNPVADRDLAVIGAREGLGQVSDEPRAVGQLDFARAPRGGDDECFGRPRLDAAR